MFFVLGNRVAHICLKMLCARAEKVVESERKYD